MFRIITLAFALSITGTAQAEEPCTTATNGTTTWAWCPTGNNCYEVTDGDYLPTVDSSEEDCLSHANEPIENEHVEFETGLNEMTDVFVWEDEDEDGVFLILEEVSELDERDVRDPAPSLLRTRR